MEGIDLSVHAKLNKEKEGKKERKRKMVLAPPFQFFVNNAAMHKYGMNLDVMSKTLLCLHSENYCTCAIMQDYNTYYIR